MCIRDRFSSLAQPFQNIPLGTFPTRWLNFTTNKGSDLAQSFMVDNLITPLVYSWNFNVQYQIAPTWMIEAGYVGSRGIHPVSYTHLRAHETVLDLVCRLLLEKKKTTTN